MNSITVVGRIAADLNMRYIGNKGEPVCNFPIVENIDKEKSQSFRVSVFGKQAEQCMEFLEKGQEVTVIGDLKISDYTSKEGEVKKSIDIRANRVHFGKKSAKSAQQKEQAPQAAVVEQSATDDDLPF